MLRFSTTPAAGRLTNHIQCDSCARDDAAPQWQHWLTARAMAPLFSQVTMYHADCRRAVRGPCLIEKYSQDSSVPRRPRQPTGFCSDRSGNNRCVAMVTYVLICSTNSAAKTRAPGRKGQREMTTVLVTDTGPHITTDNVAVHAELAVELYQETTDGPFTAILVRHETRWWDDDPDPDYVDTIVSRSEFATSLPEVFAAVDAWLVTGHRLRVQPHTWRPSDSGPDVGAVLILEGRTVPTHPIAGGPLGCWAA